MPATYKKVFIFLLFLFYSNSVVAYFHVQRVGVAQGVSVPLISETYIDANQHVWLATMGQGLLWWNGQFFVPPYSDNSLGDPFVLAVCSVDDTLVLLTESYLVFYNGLNYKHIALPSERFVGLRINDNRIYLISQRSGLWELNNNQIVSVANPVPHARYSDAWLINDSTWWFTTSKGVWSERGDTLCIGVCNYNVRKLYKSPNDVLYAATTKGLFRFDDDDFVPVVNDVDVRDISFYNGHIYIGTEEQGILIRGDQPLTFKNKVHNHRIRSLVFDAAGRLWYTTADGMGVVSNPREQTYNESGVIYFRGLRSERGEVWLTGNMGWLRAGKDDTIRGVLEPGVVFAMIEDDNGNILMAGESGLDIRSNSGERIGFVLEVLPDPFITSMVVFDGSLFLGCASGIYRVDDYLALEPKVKQLYSEGVSHIMKQDNRIVALTYGMGIVVLNDEGNLIEHHSEFADSSAFGLLPSSLAIDDQGFFWLATTNVGGFIQTTNGWFHLNLEGEAAIYNWLPVGKRRMLAVTENRLLLIDAATTPPEVYTHPNALDFPSGFQDRAYPFAYHNDLVFMTSSLGRHVMDVSSFYSPLDSQLSCTPSLWRVDVFFDTHTRWHDKSGDLSPRTGVPVNVHLNYNENYLRFLFGAPKLPLLSSHLQYRYRMRPSDPEWIMSDGAMEAVYTNISPGAYRFELEARWPNGDWSSTDSVKLRIIPPWYKTWWFYTLLVVLISAIVYGVFRYRTHQVNERIRLENAVLANERIALRLQMNPHFLFNALESIGSFVLKNDPKSTLKYLNSFTKLMRLTLEAGTDKDHPVESELSLLQSYVLLEQLRFSHKFDVTFDVDDAIDYDIAIPPMLVQPHVENAVIHGLRDLEHRRGMLSIRFQRLDDSLKVEIEDNGVGRSYNRNRPRREHRSMALDINRKRIELLSKSFHRTFSLNIVDLYNAAGEAAGTKVIITLPIIYLDDL